MRPRVIKWPHRSPGDIGRPRIIEWPHHSPGNVGQLANRQGGNVFHAVH
jgi:hypothetical protein